MHATPPVPDGVSVDVTPPVPDGVVRATRAVALAGLIGLIVLGLAWELWLAPTGSGTLAIKVLPLVLCVGGLLRHRMYTYRWLSLLVWLYFTEGVVRAYSDKAPGNYLALAEVALCGVLFVACVLHVRLRQRYAKGATPNETTNEVPA